MPRQLSFSEACRKIGLQVHARYLLKNHFHLAIASLAARRPGRGFLYHCPFAAIFLLSAALNLQAQSTSQQLYFQCLTNFETYGESIWHSASYANAPADAGYWGDGATTGNGGIRGSDGVALAYAVMLIAQPDSPNNTTRLNHLRQALNYAALTHAAVGTNVAEDGHQWGWNTGTPGTCSESGSDWQTSLWTAPAALATPNTGNFTAPPSMPHSFPQADTL